MIANSDEINGRRRRAADDRAFYPRGRTVRRRASILTGLVMVLLSPAGAAGQDPAAPPDPGVERRGRGDADNDAFLGRFLATGEYVLFVRDTAIAHADTIRGNALVLRATVRIDGVVDGDLVGVDANVFLRPTARVLGNVRNIAGGFYPSDLAVIAGTTHSEPTAPYFVQEREDGTFVIQGLIRHSALVLSGVYGLQPPAYDRVDGLTLTAGAGLLLPRIERFEPILRGRVDYRSQRGVITGGAELGLPRGDTELAVGAERTTLTNERWISSDLANSVTYFFTGTDYRDYYEADRAYVELRRMLETGTRTTTMFLRGQVEEARTLPAGSPWTVLGTPREDNIVVAESRIASAVAGGSVDWIQPGHVVQLGGTLEAAGTMLRGAHNFVRYVADADWAMAGFSNHTLRIQAHAQGPLPGTDSLPPQRWSFVGGNGTLHTFDMAEFRGDRVAFVETTYSVPVRRMRVRLLGVPDLQLMHLAGMAWTATESRTFEQNVGVRLRFSFINVRVVLDPALPLDKARFIAGFNIPRRSYPWEPVR